MLLNVGARKGDFRVVLSQPVKINVAVGGDDRLRGFETKFEKLKDVGRDAERCEGLGHDGADGL